MGAQHTVMQFWQIVECDDFIAVEMGSRTSCVYLAGIVYELTGMEQITRIRDLSAAS